MGIVVTTDVKEKNRYSPVFRTHKSANRLTDIYDDQTNLVASYTYDPFGRRISKQVGTNTTYYLYSDEGLIAEYDEAGNEIWSYGYAPNTLWMNNPLYTRTESHTSTNKAYYYYLNDHLGAPQKLMAKNGEIVWSGVSEAFGKTTVSIETIKNNLRFSSQYYDEESQLYYNTHRFFDSELGRYVSRDPLIEKGGVYYFGYRYYSSQLGRLMSVDPVWEIDFNSITVIDYQSFYLFAKNSPIIWYDYLGLDPDCNCPPGSNKGTKQNPDNFAKTDGKCTSPLGNSPPGMKQSFLSACLSHDQCYATCGASKSLCDETFLYGMLGTCAGDGVCEFWAGLYYAAVVVAGDSFLAGDQSFSSLQKDACLECCCD